MKVLGKEYDPASKLLFLSERVYYLDKNSWISYVDSFNDTILRSWLVLLHRKSPNINWPRLRDVNGQLVPIGVLLHSSNQLCKRYPAICDTLRFVHQRRSSAPTSHPYDTKTGVRARTLLPGEQRKMRRLLQTCYGLFLQEVQSLV